MSTVNLRPVSSVSEKRLERTGSSYESVLQLLGPSAVYTSSLFVTSSYNAVTLAYNFYAGNIMDIELEEENIYIAWQSAILKWSYLVNAHHAKSVLYDLLGYATATFNSNGEVTTGSDLSGKLPTFNIGYARKMAQAFSAEIGVGGNSTWYSASFNITQSIQDYNLEDVLRNNPEFSASLVDKRVLIRDVYYKSNLANWRYFGFWGGFNSFNAGIGFGQYANDTTFHVTPAWETKLQAMSIEDTLWTRTSHYTFELINNRLRIFPIPYYFFPEKMWFRFSIDDSALNDSMTGSAVNGINNFNSLPFGNIPLEHINGPGWNWIREYFLAYVARILGLVRGKFGGEIPFVKERIRLNSQDLLSLADKELTSLEDKLIKILDDMVFAELAKRKQSEVDAAMSTLSYVPSMFYVK